MVDFPGGTSGKEPACQCRRHKERRLNPWVKKIPWRKEWQPTPVFLPRESAGTEEPGGLQFMGLQRVKHGWSNLARSTHIGDGMGSAYLNHWQGVRDPGLLGAFIQSLRLSWRSVCASHGQPGCLHWSLLFGANRMGSLEEDTRANVGSSAPCQD